MSSSTKVQWKPCAVATGRSFDIVSNVQAVPHPCSTDWIQVKGLDKVCEPFAELTSEWKPYELLVNFDEAEFPPPPPTFSIPVDPSNCPATCLSQPPAYTCGCLPNPDMTNQICQCVIDAPTFTQYPDFNNTGFCLDYTQL